MKKLLVCISFVFRLTTLYADSLCEESSEEEVVLTLETSLPRALNYNRQILNTQDGIVKADYQVSIAYSEFDLRIRPNADAGYVGGGSVGSGPSYGLGAEFYKKLPQGTTISVSPLLQKAAKSFSSILNSRITQPLLRGFGREYAMSNLHGAQFSLRSSNRTFFIAQCQLIYRVITSLYEYVKAERSVILNAESHSRLQKFHKSSVIKARIGLSDPLDLYRAENELNHAEESLKSSQEKFQESEDAIRDILALPPNAKLIVNIPVFYTQDPISLDEAIEMALKNRVEIDQAYDQHIENIRLSKIAKDRLWPELNLVLNYNNLGNDQVFTESWRKRESTWGIGFTTSTDFNPAAEQAIYDQSLLGIEVATRNIDQTISNITFDVKRALRNLDRIHQRIEIQEKQVTNAEGELRLAQIKFDRGMGNNFDLIQAEKSLRIAQLSHWNALMDHIIGEYQLRTVLGLLMEKPCL